MRWAVIVLCACGSTPSKPSKPAPVAKPPPIVVVEAGSEPRRVLRPQIDPHVTATLQTITSHHSTHRLGDNELPDVSKRTIDATLDEHSELALEWQPYVIVPRAWPAVPLGRGARWTHRIDDATLTSWELVFADDHLIELRGTTTWSSVVGAWPEDHSQTSFETTVDTRIVDGHLETTLIRRFRSEGTSQMGYSRSEQQTDGTVTSVDQPSATPR